VENRLVWRGEKVQEQDVISSK